MIVTVKQAKKVWEKDDRRIYELQVEVGGKVMPAKTYSDAIGVEGWSGDVVTYDKPGRNGVEKFLKQAPKEEGYGGSKPSYQPRDDSHIKAQWAIGQAGLLIEDKNDLEGIETLAKDLFAMVDRVKGLPAPDEDEPLPDAPNEEQELPPDW